VTSVAEQRVREGEGVVSGPVGDGTLLDELFSMRDEYRALAETGESLVDGSSLPWEINRQGETKWYMHPRKHDTSLRSLIVYRQRIPAGSRSGRQLHPGGIAHYILSGSGHTMLDGERHDWKAGDLVALPVRPHGIDYQHFNDDPKHPVDFIAATPNLVEILGVDLGGRFEQLESAPEYAPYA
jgi:quercetin dioxygenase-like cupin family protein